MLRLEVLAAKPAAFVSFTGLTPVEFRALADDLLCHNPGASTRCSTRPDPNYWVVSRSSCTPEKRWETA
jgi:hypothetical protein